MRLLFFIAALGIGLVSYAQTAYQVREIIDTKKELAEYPQSFEISIDDRTVSVGDAHFDIMYEEDLKHDASEAIKGKTYKLFQTRNEYNYVLEIEHNDYEVFVTLYEHEGDQLIGSTIMKAVNL